MLRNVELAVFFVKVTYHEKNFATLQVFTRFIIMTNRRDCHWKSQCIFRISPKIQKHSDRSRIFWSGLYENGLIAAIITDRNILEDLSLVFLSDLYVVF